MTLTVNQSLHKNHGYPFCPINKNKQLIDSQIGVNYTPSRGGRYVSPYQTVSCLLQAIKYKCWVSRCAHKFTVQKWKEAWKMVEDNHAHQTQINLYKKILPQCWN